MATTATYTDSNIPDTKFGITVKDIQEAVRETRKRIYAEQMMRVKAEFGSRETLYRNHSPFNFLPPNVK